MATCDAGNMHTEKQALLEFQENLPPRNSPNNEESPLRPSCSNHGVPKKPGKRPTRQWAAWTREEEECFFTALRQVGKNFEKITSRVQSKNKDQVRHYYYRLVRRMNKLLGPGFSLDAKNSKDTNAAMLRWWSLLEKYSCKASKLHLKPRRFKIFIEALEHQLLKDRKKNVRRRLPQGENCPSLCPAPSLQQNKPSINETHSVKFVLVDSQNIQKAGIGKGSTLRRNPNSGINKSSNKGDSSPTKASRQRRKTGGTLSAAAVKRWEKAAIAGVSLVADAAEHLERNSCGKEPETCGASAVHTSLQAEACAREENCLGPSNVVQPPLPRTSSNVPPESFTQNTGKLKLQLFPIDDGTKRALELDKHNPYLELTLSTRKKITSVMEHLSKKWGNCTVACGELTLFPYSAERENILKCERWTRESFVTAADVYAVIGSPSVFRLRYGWISASELQSATPSTFSGISLVDPTSPSGPGPWSNVLGTHNKDKEASSSHGNAVPQPMNDSPDEATEYAGSDPENDILDLYGFGENIVCRRSLTGFGADKMGTGNNSATSAGEWADSLTNVSVGDLLTEVSDVEADCVEPPCTGSSPCHEEIPFTCDSFDAAIAAHILSHQNKMGFQSAATSSIWDAEETCDAFSFQNRSLNKEHAQSSSIRASSPYHGDNIRTNSVGSDSFLKGLHEEEEMVDTAGQGDLMDEAGPSEPDLQEASSKDFNTLTDMYWPESLGPLDLDAPSCRFYSQDIILSDSLGGLSRLIASSLDAFQNCSFFNIEKKETSPAATEAQAKASAFDNITDDEV